MYLNDKKDYFIGTVVPLFLVMIIALFSAKSYSETYYVKNDGDDSKDGKSWNGAYKTPNQAASVANAGDLILVKGGKYNMASTIKFTNSGTADSYIKMFAESGETPEFDFSNSSGRGFEIKKSYIHVKGITVAYPKDRGITICSTGVILEGVTVHHAAFDGIVLTGKEGVGATNCLILNCDSYLNWETGTDGNNGDGFAAKDGGTGNVFRGCRAWLNADDGWDTYGNVNPVLIDSCWAFSNGHNVFGYPNDKWKGNGNGFKLGAAGPKNAKNIIINSVAFGNVSKGFDQNHNIKGLTAINCTGYMNMSSFGNFAFQDATSDGKHVLKNNLSIPYGNTKSHTLAAGTEEVTNSWNLSLTLKESDFVSLDTSLATKQRNANYSLPQTGLFRLKSSNPAINQGTPITYSFDGKTYKIEYKDSKPDLGAFEYSSGTAVINTYQHDDNGIQCDVNIGKEYSTFLIVNDSKNQIDNGMISVFNIAGQTIKKIHFNNSLTSKTSFSWNYENMSGSKIAGGNYLATFKLNYKNGSKKVHSLMFTK